MDKATEYLKGVINALNGISVQGYQNCAIIVACTNDIKTAIQLLDAEKANQTKPKSDKAKE